MPRSGGVYSLPSGNPVESGSVASSTAFNDTMDDLGDEITNSVPRDGSAAATANLPMGGFKHSNVGNSSARNQYAATGQVQDGAFHTLSNVAGTNTITGDLSPAITSYASSLRINFKPAAANTSACTIAINGLGAVNIYKATGDTSQSVTELVAGDLITGFPAEMIYNGSAFILFNPQSETPPLIWNSLISNNEPFQRTAAEIAAGVTPSNYAYEPGDQRRYSTWANFIAVLEQGVIGYWWNDASISSIVNATGDIKIIAMGTPTLTASASMVNMLRTTGKLVIVGEHGWTFDGDDNVTAACIHTDDTLPVLKNGTLANAQLGWATGSTTDGLTYGATGEGLLDNMHAQNCALIGFAARGNATVFAGRMVMKNCRTSGTTGSGDWDGTGRGFLLHFSGFDYVRFEGGDFTGDADAYVTNAHKCNTADIDGGRYYDIKRGATLGNSTKKFSIRGVVVDACSEIGIAVDTTTGTGSIDGYGTITGCVATECGRAFRSTCSTIRIDGFAAYECTDTSGIFAFAGDGADVDIANITCLSTAGSGSYCAFLATENTTVNVGQNVRTDSTSRLAFTSLSAVTSAFRFGPEGRTITANSDLRGSDYGSTIFVDATSGGVDLDLFDFDEVSAAGFEFWLQWINTTNQITVTFQAGATAGESLNYRGVNATSFAIPAGTPSGRAHFKCDTSGKTWWVDGVPPQAIYSVTNATTDRSYDADSAAVTETNDVLATLLSDLGLR